MLTTVTQGAAMVTPVHGASSLSTSTPVASSSSGQRAVAAAPRRSARRGVSRVSCSSSGGSTTTTLTTEAANGPVAGTVALPALTQLPALGEETITMKATVRVHMELMLIDAGDAIRDLLSDLMHMKWLRLELLSAELNPKTWQPWEPVVSYADNVGTDQVLGFLHAFEATFNVPASFGPIGAVRVVNQHRRETLLWDIKVFPAGDESRAVTFHCDSWVHAEHDNPDDKRVFFPLESYLPSQTPKGLEALREGELAAIRGDGTGERKAFERIYDYDVYDDLGDPDAGADMQRPVLGGSDRPYPRRCRTGRRKEGASEVRAATNYVPRDEAFTERKNLAFKIKYILSTEHAKSISKKEPHVSFPSLAAIDALFDGSFRNLPEDDLGLQDIIEELRHLDKFETPEIYSKDKFAWFRDEEFARETLAGMNPLSIQLVTELPIVSKLDEATYGVQESLITKELIERQINGVMTADEALENKRLFMLDYHDMFLPYVNTVRGQDNTTLYASRTLFFLSKDDEMDPMDGTLRPIAIELTRPKSPARHQWRKVFTPGMDGSVTGSWLWQLAKTHVLAHDTGYHQLVSHWLRTHCSVEPYVIAANRQLSQMHPIYRLLHPHFRFTMEINALARSLLISGGGIIESSFSPGKYCMELSSGVYDKLWRFDMEALPADLVRRGMAVENGKTGELELAIPDYPYANDGLLVWDSIKKWASDYVTRYYPAAADIAGDVELQAWWTEVRTKGHEDKQGEPWWPALDGHDNLVQVLTTIMWVTSGHHAAVNFGQYPYAGYFPNRPTTARRNVPPEGGADDMRAFAADPEKALLDTFPSQFQASLALPVLDVLSSHSSGEEYMGSYAEPAWTADGEVAKAFDDFQGRMREVVGHIDQRNADATRKNRNGAGVLPYVLLRPNTPDPTGDGTVMGMGIPNSISI